MIEAGCLSHPAFPAMCYLILQLELDEDLQEIPQSMHGSVLFVLFAYPM